LRGLSSDDGGVGCGRGSGSEKSKSLELDSKRSVSRKNCKLTFLCTKMFGRLSEKKCICLRLTTRVGNM